LVVKSEFDSINKKLAKQRLRMYASFHSRETQVPEEPMTDESAEIAKEEHKIAEPMSDESFEISKEDDKVAKLAS